MLIPYYIFAGFFVFVGLLLGIASWGCELRNYTLQKFFRIFFGLGALCLVSSGILMLIGLKTLPAEKQEIVQKYYMSDKMPTVETVQGNKFLIMKDNGIRFTEKEYAYITYFPLETKIQQWVFEGSFETLYIPQED